jgi:putative tryptophan/tyrosine transport system substrate-binding protein
MKRRAFITLLGGAAASAPIAARAQQLAIPVVGYLASGTPEMLATGIAAFRKGLSEMGFAEGRNMTIEFRWTQNDESRLQELAADLVRRRPAVIAASPTGPTLAIKALTSTIPIVFNVGADPLRSGLVASFNRPEGNVTGVNSMTFVLGPKRLGHLNAYIPSASRYAVLVDPRQPVSDVATKDAQSAAAAIGRQIETFSVTNSRDIDTAFASFASKRIEALLVSAQPLFSSRRVQIVNLAARHALPAIYSGREFAEVGGLMSYGTSTFDQYRQFGLYVGRILKGEKPADLPVMRAVRFEFVINLQTARTLGIDVPPTLLAIADEVIE